MNVACVLNVGDFRRRTYSPEWVQKLHRMVERTTPGVRFVCLSNVPVEGVETIPLEDGLPGWWAKLELFKPGRFTGRTLYLDLDVLVLEDLTPLFETKGEFVAMKADVDWPTRIDREGKRVTAGLNSGTLAWDNADYLYTEFRREFIEDLRGDQDWIAEQVSDVSYFPREWFERLKNCPDGPPEAVKVLHCMPWKNDVAAKKFPWVKKLWG